MWLADVRFWGDLLVCERTPRRKPGIVSLVPVLPWLLNLPRPDPETLAQLATVALLLWVLLLAIYTCCLAVTGRRASSPQELKRLYRRIDEVRRQLREAGATGQPVEQLQELLRQLRQQLPNNDLRRH